ncbi:MAG: hypothetical protein NC311_00530 [Muribaculaceae bacterium]|nr:hypothetical protein [Muribaculaceae bacterium]
MFKKNAPVSAENLINIDQLGNNNIVANGEMALAVGGSFVFQPIVCCQTKNDETGILNKFLERQIDCVKDYLNEGKALDALTKIEDIEKNFKDVFEGALADKNARRRLFLNKGSALMLSERTTEAAMCYLEGYECDPQNELANALRVKGYFIKNDIVGLKKAITEIPPAHKTSRLIAGYILEAIQTDVQNFPTMPDVINELCFDDVTNCIIASKFYSVRDNPAKASEYFIKAKQIAPDDWQVLALEGTELLGNEPYKTSFVQIKQAKDLLEKSWNAIREQNSVPFRDLLYVPINLSSAYRVLGMQKEEKELVDDLYIRFPEEPDVILKKILVTENKIDAANIAKKLNTTTSFHYAIAVAIAYMDIKDYDSALKILRNISKGDMDLFSIDLLSISCNKELNSIDAMDAIIQRQKSRAVKSLFSYIKTNNIDELSKAYKLLHKHDDINTRIEIVVRLYQNKCYTEAAILYSDIRKKLNIPNLFLKEFLNCLWSLKRLPDLRAELEKIPKEYVDSQVKQYWVAYYNDIGDYPNAIIVAEEIFNEEKNNANYATNLLGLYHKTNQRDKIIPILQELPGDLNEMVGDFANKWQLILLMQECDYSLEELAEKAYCLVCQNMDKEEAWSAYLAWVMANLSSDKIKNDKTGFVLRDRATGAIRIFIVDENPKINTNQFFEVLRGTEQEFKVLLTATQKDVIKLDPAGIDLEVFSISNKYILLKDIIQQNIFIKFSNCPINRLDGTTPEEVIGKIRPLFEARQNNFDLLKSYYYKCTLPISTIASMLGRDSIDVAHELSKEKLFVASGTISEREQTLQIVKNCHGYIVDAMTIYNIFEFELQDLLAKYFAGKIYVSQKTKDIIQNKAISLQNSIRQKNGYMFLTNATEHKVAIATFDDLEAYYLSELNMLNSILDWVDKYTNIIIPQNKMYLTEEQKDLLAFFQEHDQETAVIIESALENKLIILSDDYILRLGAKSQFSIDGIWLQCLLMYTSGISLSDYVSFIIKSVNKNHSFLSFDSRVLLEVLLTDKTQELQNFKKIAKRLSDCTSESAFRVLCGFYVVISKRSCQTIQVDIILIDAFLGGGRHNDFLNRLFALKVIAEQDEIFDAALKNWATGHFVSL